MVEYTARCSRSLPQGCGGARPGPLIRAALGCCEGHGSTNITPLSKRTLGPAAERLLLLRLTCSPVRADRECSSYGRLITKSNPGHCGTAYSWKWEHVNSLVVFPIFFSFFWLFRGFDSKLFISIVMKGHFRRVSVPDVYLCCLFGCDKPDE